MNEKVKSFLVISKQGDVGKGFIHVRYGEKKDDPLPFILTVTAQHVARETQKTLPPSIIELQQYVEKYQDTTLKDIALNRKAAGFTTHVLD